MLERKGPKYHFPAGVLNGFIILATDRTIQEAIVNKNMKYVGPGWKRKEIIIT